jgi:hypothetical protein
MPGVRDEQPPILGGQQLGRVGEQPLGLARELGRKRERRPVEQALGVVFGDQRIDGGREPFRRPARSG